MDSHKHSTQVERLEVVETGRRRGWSDDEKLRIVMESLQTTRAISSTARRHGISRSLLMTWRRSFSPEPTVTEAQQAGFVPAMVVATETAPTEERPEIVNKLLMDFLDGWVGCSWGQRKRKNKLSL